MAAGGRLGAMGNPPGSPAQLAVAQKQVASISHSIVNHTDAIAILRQALHESLTGRQVELTTGLQQLLAKRLKQPPQSPSNKAPVLMPAPQLWSPRGNHHMGSASPLQPQMPQQQAQQHQQQSEQQQSQPQQSQLQQPQQHLQQQSQQQPQQQALPTPLLPSPQQQHQEEEDKSSEECSMSTLLSQTGNDAVNSGVQQVESQQQDEADSSATQLAQQRLEQFMAQMQAQQEQQQAERQVAYRALQRDLTALQGFVAKLLCDNRTLCWEALHLQRLLVQERVMARNACEAVALHLASSCIQAHQQCESLQARLAAATSRPSLDSLGEDPSASQAAIQQGQQQWHQGAAAAACLQGQQGGVDAVLVQLERQLERITADYDDDEWAIDINRQLTSIEQQCAKHGAPQIITSSRASSIVAEPTSCVAVSNSSTTASAQTPAGATGSCEDAGSSGQQHTSPSSAAASSVCAKQQQQHPAGHAFSAASATGHNNADDPAAKALVRGLQQTMLDLLSSAVRRRNTREDISVQRASIAPTTVSQLPDEQASTHPENANMRVPGRRSRRVTAEWLLSTQPPTAAAAPRASTPPPATEATEAQQLRALTEECNALSEQLQDLRRHSASSSDGSGDGSNAPDGACRVLKQQHSEQRPGAQQQRQTHDQQLAHASGFDHGVSPSGAPLVQDPDELGVPRSEYARLLSQWHELQAEQQRLRELLDAVQLENDHLHTQVHELEAQKRALQKSDSVKAINLAQVAMGESDALMELQELRQQMAAQTATCSELRLQLQQLQAQHQQQAHLLQQQAQQVQQAAQPSSQLQPWQRQHAHAKLMQTLEQQQQQLKEYQQVLASERKAYAELLARSPPPKPPVARPAGLLLRRSTSSSAATSDAITSIGVAARAAALRKIASMRQTGSSNAASNLYNLHQ